MFFHQTKSEENWIKKFEKILTDEENNEIGEEFNVDEIESNLVNNFVPKMRPRYVPIGRTTNFFFGFIPRKNYIF